MVFMEKNNKFNPTLIIIIVIGIALLITLLLVFTGGDDETEPVANNDNQTQDSQDSNSTDTETGNNEQAPTTPTPTPTPDPTPAQGSELPGNWNQLSSAQKTDLNPYNCAENKIIRADNGRCLPADPDGELVEPGLPFFEELEEVEFEIQEGYSFTKTGDKVAVNFVVNNPTESFLPIWCGYQGADGGGGFYLGGEYFNVSPGVNPLFDEDIVGSVLHSNEQLISNLPDGLVESVEHSDGHGGTYLIFPLYVLECKLREKPADR